MSTQKRNLSDNKIRNITVKNTWKIAIITAEWNPDVTHAMEKAAVKTLKENGINQDNIICKKVPGSFELVKGAKYYADYTGTHAVICLGCIIQGETRHFDFVAQGVTDGIRQLNLDYEIPFIFGVLTTQDRQQALDRAGGKHGNKGDEAAAAALKMLSLKSELL